MFHPILLVFLSSLVGLIILLVFVLERFMWAISLKSASGEDDMAWFFVIFYLPIIGWMLYYITK